ncbi:MAG: diacylglycerol kinase family protein [Clostridia bacterium]|nr:diacylglycerol kinase family protein [Clostridia bacterium]MBR5773126.1 diacylglycerol kinase family protein [Clostridia bacterium]
MKDFLKGFVYAGRGVVYCLVKERNMRIHLCFTAYMFGFLTLYDFFEISNAEYGVLLALCALVMGLEAVNTAVERAVNLACPEDNPVAGAAKDAAAGAVLIAAFFSVVAGVVIMFQPEAFVRMKEYYSENVLALVALIVSVVFSLAFVFLPSVRFKPKNEEDAGEEDENSETGDAEDILPESGEEEIGNVPGENAETEEDEDEYDPETSDEPEETESASEEAAEPENPAEEPGEENGEDEE